MSVTKWLAESPCNHCEKGGCLPFGPDHPPTQKKKKKDFGFAFIEEKEGSKGPRTMVTELAMAFNHLWERAFFAPRLCLLYYAAWAPARPSFIQ